MPTTLYVVGVVRVFVFSGILSWLDQVRLIAAKLIVD
jgi:hypothetical protein